jgi:hypothetical protein
MLVKRVLILRIKFGVKSKIAGFPSAGNGTGSSTEKNAMKLRKQQEGGGKPEGQQGWCGDGYDERIGSEKWQRLAAHNIVLAESSPHNEANTNPTGRRP